ncbi:MAG: NYN domain-containing protein [Clostridiaceae bacterium]|jgi:uncharacterized LabA/DUF88 family protein|nr:NYN domain-containing protein [Clostridiaceae bacterium]
MNRTAILIDGGFFVKRAIRLWGKKSPEELANILQDYVNRHLKRNREDYHQLYRIFYYDCPPISKKIHHPLTNRLIDYSKTEQYEWRLAFHEQLRKLRKMALRLGHLDEEGTDWVLDPRVLRSVISGKLLVAKLREDDFLLNTKQKGVDMKIGVDIASMAYKKQVEQMILIAGDSDFVPAAKLARREGIDFLLDPLWAQIKPDLFEHIDGIRTVCEKPADGKEFFDDVGKADMGYDSGEDEDAGLSMDNLVPTPQPVAEPAKPVPVVKPAAGSQSPPAPSAAQKPTTPASAATAPAQTAAPAASGTESTKSPRHRTRRKSQTAAKQEGEAKGSPASAAQPSTPPAPAKQDAPAKQAPATKQAETATQSGAAKAPVPSKPVEDTPSQKSEETQPRTARPGSRRRRHTRPVGAVSSSSTPATTQPAPSGHSEE